jgi:hypothetical protein
LTPVAFECIERDQTLDRFPSPAALRWTSCLPHKANGGLVHDSAVGLWCRRGLGQLTEALGGHATSQWSISKNDRIRRCLGICLHAKSAQWEVNIEILSHLSQASKFNEEKWQTLYWGRQGMNKIQVLRSLDFICVSTVVRVVACWSRIKCHTQLWWRNDWLCRLLRFLFRHSSVHLSFNWSKTCNLCFEKFLLVFILNRLFTCCAAGCGRIMHIAIYDARFDRRKKVAHTHD